MTALTVENVVRTYADRLAHAYPDQAADIIEERDEILAALAAEAASEIDVERLARALHEIGAEFDDPFDGDHPRGMHNSQAAALAAAYRDTR
jgi:hypothetical protein